MAGIRTEGVWAPVPSAMTEVAPTTMIGQFETGLVGAGPLDPVYIRPGQRGQQDYANIDGAEWILYTRSVMSYDIVWEKVAEAAGGATLIVELGSVGHAGIPEMRDYLVFHIIGEDFHQSHRSGIELPGLLARFRIMTSNYVDSSCVVGGSIIVRAL